MMPRRARCSSRRTDSQAPTDMMMLLGDAVMLLSTEFVRCRPSLCPAPVSMLSTSDVTRGGNPTRTVPHQAASQRQAHCRASLLFVLSHRCVDRRRIEPICFPARYIRMSAWR